MLPLCSDDPFSVGACGHSCFLYQHRVCRLPTYIHRYDVTSASGLMTSSNGNIFRVTGHLCGEFTGPGEFPALRPVTRSFDVFFDLRPNTRLSKQSWGWWFETPSSPLWRHCNGCLKPLLTPLFIKHREHQSSALLCLENAPVTGWFPLQRIHFFIWSPSFCKI